MMDARNKLENKHVKEFIEKGPAKVCDKQVPKSKDSIAQLEEKVNCKIVHLDTFNAHYDRDKNELYIPFSCIEEILAHIENNTLQNEIEAMASNIMNNIREAYYITDTFVITRATNGFMLDNSLASSLLEIKIKSVEAFTKQEELHYQIRDYIRAKYYYEFLLSSIFLAGVSSITGVHVKAIFGAALINNNEKVLLNMLSASHLRCLFEYNEIENLVDLSQTAVGRHISALGKIVDACFDIDDDSYIETCYEYLKEWLNEKRSEL